MSTSKSVYDVPLKSWDGEDGFLEKYRGKVSLVVNVTADCGNSPQYESLEDIYNKYKDKGFEIIAVPTNDFCGPGITYNEFAENGISCGLEARKYAIDKYNVSYDFSEMVVSKPHESWREKRNNYGETHELYEVLTEESVETMGGNFEKFLVDRDGKLVKRFHNYMMLDYYKTNVEAGVVEEMSHQEHPPLSKQEAYDLICSEIEKIL
jgi:glutathione peroxidase